MKGSPSERKVKNERTGWLKDYLYSGIRETMSLVYIVYTFIKYKAQLRKLILSKFN